MDVASILSDDDYDIVSNPGQHSLESSTADFGHIPAQIVYEPPPSQMARDKIESVSWTAKDIQTYVRKALGIAGPKLPLGDITKRVYLDGVFDGLSAGSAAMSCAVWLLLIVWFTILQVCSPPTTGQTLVPLSLPHRRSLF